MTGAPLPRNLRLKALVVCEFLLRQYGRMAEAGGGDVERYVIYLAVASASTRRIFRDPKLRALYGDAVPAPPEERSAVSRRAIAKSVGLPRETVRRKLQELIDAGILAENSRGVTLSGPALEQGDNIRLVQDVIGEMQRATADIARLDSE